MHAIALQWSIHQTEPEANMAMASELLHRASPETGDLVVLPELWPTEYSSLAMLQEVTESDGPHWTRFCAELCETYGVTIVGSAPFRRGDELTNRLTVVGSGGNQLGFYDKIHLFPPMGETQLFAHGRRIRPIPLADSPFVLGPAICYDLRFPELFRLLATRGATLFVVPSEFPDPKEDLWHLLLSARAAENQAYLVACNRTGESDSFSFFGSSAVYDPLGRCVGRLGREEGFLKVPLEPEAIARARESLSVLTHVRLSIEV